MRKDPSPNNPYRNRPPRSAPPQPSSPGKAPTESAPHCLTAEAFERALQEALGEEVKVKVLGEAAPEPPPF